MIINRVIKAADVISRRVGDELVVLKETADSAHILNKTAAAIWEICDGERGLDDIAMAICDRFEVPFDEARADTEEIIGRFIQAGIMMQSAAPAE